MKNLKTKAAPAEFTFTPNTYAGEQLAGYMAQALLGGRLVADGLISVIDNVKKRKVLRSIDDTFEFQDPAAKFNAQASPDVDIQERYLDPVTYEVMREYSFEALKTSWEAQALKPGSLNDYDGTVDLSDWLVQRAVDRIAILNEKLFILGKGSDSAFTFTAGYTGLLPKMLADSNVNFIDPNTAEVFAISGISAAATPVVTVASTSLLYSGDTVTILGVAGTGSMAATLNGNSYTINIINGTTFSLNGVSTAGMGTTPTFTNAKAICVNKSNVVGVLASIYQRIPDQLRLQSDLKMYLPMHIMRAYKLSQATGVNVVGGFVGDKEADFLGAKLTEMPYWKGNTILVARVSNLFLGVDLLSDESTIETLDLRKTTLDQVMRMKCGMKSDVNYMFPTELTMYRPA